MSSGADALQTNRGVQNLSDLAIKPDQGAVEHLFDDSYDKAIDPFVIFETWYTEAVTTEPNDPNAAALASADENGFPDVRMLLMNGRDRSGLVFFTNFNSAKAQQMLKNPQAAVLFHWKSLRRQVRLRGAAEPVSKSEADAYFSTRPRKSRIGAHASNQSHPLKSRKELVNRTTALEAQFEDIEVPRPEYWLGFRIKPLEIEFWQDGEARLHDRMKFTRNDTSDSIWSRTRLNP